MGYLAVFLAALLLLAPLSQARVLEAAKDAGKPDVGDSSKEGAKTAARCVKEPVCPPLIVLFYEVVGGEGMSSCTCPSQNDRPKHSHCTGHGLGGQRRAWTH